MTVQELSALLRTTCIVAKESGVTPEEIVGALSESTIAVFSDYGEEGGSSGTEGAIKYFSAIADTLRSEAVNT